ncbi:hypothetical protein B0H10DRAFT_2230179 [Mycena sp. CBHHK59/15]|nr:hypothetical protein B0H10DRAFT_2230179 [Mycena sp. CBHHK59/15]
MATEMVLEGGASSVRRPYQSSTPAQQKNFNPTTPVTRVKRKLTTPTAPSKPKRQRQH